MLSSHLILCCPLHLLPSIFPSIRVVSNELALPITWPKYWNFSFSISPSDEYSGLLISFRIAWFDLAVLGPLKSLLQHYSLKASILQLSAFFTVQLSYSYITGIIQAKILEWVAISFSRVSSQPRDQTQVFYIAGRFLPI